SFIMFIFLFCLLYFIFIVYFFFFLFQAEDGIRDLIVTGVQTCALPISVSLSLIWSVAMPGAPMVAPTGLLRESVSVSAPSAYASSLISTGNALLLSFALKTMVPRPKVKSPRWVAVALDRKSTRLNSSHD